MLNLKSLVAALSLIVTSSYAYAQIAIKGEVRDPENKPVANATVSLLHAKDSTLVKYALSDKEGKYEFEKILSGDYLLTISSIGYRQYYSSTISVANNNDIIIPSVQLQQSAKELKEISITTSKPLIEQKLDRLVVNVDAMISNTGSTVLEVLEKSPGVTVDRDGNIAMKGKQNVLVLIDGKQTYLSREQLADYLRSLPSSAIEQIELMTNPSAKYDASGNAGIINIKTKKNKLGGFNGNASISYGQGIYYKVNSSVNLNYRNNKINLFGNFSQAARNNFNEVYILRRYTNPDGSLNAIFEQNSYITTPNESYNAKVGLDYFLNKNSTLGFVITGYYGPERAFGHNIIYLKDKNAKTDSIVYAASDASGKWKNPGINFNLRHAFDTTGREITADLDYLEYNVHGKQLFTNTVFNPDMTLRNQDFLRGDLPTNINIYSAKIDYTHPLKKVGKIEAGIKSSYVQTINSANYYKKTTGDETPDYDKTNSFDYKENLNAAYLNWSKQIKKWGLQAGLRLENTNYKGQQYGNPTRSDSSFSNNYNSLFPTLFISYTANDKHQFGFNYGRRIDRPAYQDLNPFLFFLDKYTFAAGNPFLQPQFTDNFELSHTYKGILTTTINYGNTKNIFAQTFEQKDYATIQRSGNIGRSQNAGITVTAQLNPFKWWTAVLYNNFTYINYKGKLYGEDIDINIGTFLVNVTNQFKFNKGWSAELSGFYRTKGVDGQIQVNPLGRLDIGIQKQILKDKGTIKLNARDILYTMPASGEIDFQSTAAHFDQKRDTRSITIGLSYRFGKVANGNNPSRKTGGADTEKDRVRAGQ